MKLVRRAVAFSIVSLLLSGGAAFAQDYHHDDNGHHDDHGHPDDHGSRDHGGHYDDHGGHDHYVHHDDWHHGGHISHDDWNRGRQIDYRQYHLNAPPRGYGWREVDGNYVLASIATGVIASAIVASAAGR